MGDATDVVVIGGGFIGLEVASSLQKMGKNVTVLEFGPRLVGRAVGEETAEHFLQAHRSRGLDIRLNTSVARFTADDGGSRVAAVELQDGTLLHDTGWAHVDESRIISEGFSGDLQIDPPEGCRVFGWWRAMGLAIIHEGPEVAVLPPDPRPIRTHDPSRPSAHCADPRALH